MHASVAFGKKLVVDLVPSPDLEKTTKKVVKQIQINCINAYFSVLEKL